MGPGSTGDTGFGGGIAVTFGPGGLISGSAGVAGGTGTAAPCGSGTSCGTAAQGNNLVIIVVVIAVAVLLLR